MIKRKGIYQIENLISNHKSLESKGQMRFDWNVLYNVGMIFSRAIKYYLHTLKKKLGLKKYERPNFWNNKSPSFRTPILDSRGKVTFGCSPYGEAQSII
jgi:hypothetical protein